MISMIVLMISVMAMIIFMIIILWSFYVLRLLLKYSRTLLSTLLPFLVLIAIIYLCVTMVVKVFIMFSVFDQIDYRYLNHDNLYVRCILSHDVHLLRLSFATLAPYPATPAPPAINVFCHVETFCFVDLCDFDYLDAHRYLLHDYDDDDHHHSISTSSVLSCFLFDAS